MARYGSQDFCGIVLFSCYGTLRTCDNQFSTVMPCPKDGKRRIGRIECQILQHGHGIRIGIYFHNNVGNTVLENGFVTPSTSPQPDYLRLKRLYLFLLRLPLFEKSSNSSREVIGRDSEDFA